MSPDPGKSRKNSGLDIWDQLDNYKKILNYGGMAEWFKAAVLKTVERKFRGFESYSLRHPTLFELRGAGHEGRQLKSLELGVSPEAPLGA